MNELISIASYEKSATVEYAVEVDRLKLHGFIERLLLGLLQVLLDVEVDLFTLLVLVIGYICSVPFPSSLFLLAKILIILRVLILTLNANTKLSTLESSFIAKAILLLAV